MQLIDDIDLVSDGIIVHFTDGPSCYFAAGFLRENVGRGTNHIFLDYDPSPEAPVRLIAAVGDPGAGVSPGRAAGATLRLQSE